MQLLLDFLAMILIVTGCFVLLLYIFFALLLFVCAKGKFGWKIVDVLFDEMRIKILVF